MGFKDKIADIKTNIDLISQSLEEDSLNLEMNIPDTPNGLPTAEQFSKKLESLKNSLKSKKLKKQNNKGIFDELIGVVDRFLMAGRKVSESGKLATNGRLRQHVLDSVEATSHSAKQIVMDCVKSVLFAGDGICGGNSSISGQSMDDVYIYPREIDFLNMLKVPPESDYGKIMYESKIPKNNKEKINRNLYDAFTKPSPTNYYQYDTPGNKTLFKATWKVQDQRFHVTGLTQPQTVGGVINYGKIDVGDFFNQYYSNMEMPDINNIIKNAMLLTNKVANIKVDKTGVQVGGAATGMEDSLAWNPSLDDAINQLERMLNKLFAFCNNPPNKMSGTPTNMFHENEEDDEFYFDFDDVEGIDIDDEDARKRKVLRFKDCNNFEVPYNVSHMEDFIYLEGKLNKKDWIDGMLNKVATDAYEQSNFSIDLPNFQLSINLSFILNLPKALIMSIISPKMFLPIVIIYKLFVSTAKNILMDIKELMKRLKKLFKCIITELFWKFIREFWKRVKADLKNFLLKIIKKILREKFKRYYIVIAALIALLKKIIENGLDNCADLFSAISAAIDAAMDASGGFHIPNLLLMLSDKLPGMSPIKMTMDYKKKLHKMGLPTGPINGEPNYHILSQAASFGAMSTGLSKSPTLSTNTKPIVIATAMGPATILPGTMSLSGLPKI